MIPIKVLIVDSQALFRESLSAMLATQGSFAVIGDAEDVATAARLAAAQRPDVILTDLRLPDGRGAEVVDRLAAAQGDARIVALTELDDEETVAAAVAAGVQGYVLKRRPAAELVQALRTVADGGASLDPAVAPIIWQRFQQLVRRQDAAEAATLTPVERQVMSLLAAGQSTRQVAGQLAISPAAVEKAVAAACTKLHARNRTEAAVIARRRGLIPPP